MKKKIMLALMMGVILAVTGCGKDAATDTDKNTTEQEETVADVDEESSDTSEESEDVSNDTSTDSSSEETSKEEEAAWMDYTQTITKEVEEITSAATSIQDEMNQVETLVEKYDEMSSADISQAAMNQASQWPATVWDTELNSLWSRMSDNLDEKSKEEVLADLRVWNAMKEDAIVCAIGSEKDGGSIYAMSYQQQLSDMTRRKAYLLANTYASFLKEDFTFPEASIYGVYINSEDTSEIYDSLALTESYESGAIATISLYRTTTLTGSVTGDGDCLSFVSDEGDVEGTITYGWEGATFTVDKSSNDLVEEGSNISFPLVF